MQWELAIENIFYKQKLWKLFKFVGRAGVPMEVMGLMLGEFVDDYTVRVIDVFAMPQSGTVSILNGDWIVIYSVD